MTKQFYSIKEEVRVVGFDDGPFKRGDTHVLVVGCVFRGGVFMDGVVSTTVEVDGLDSTDKLCELLLNLRFKDVRVVMLDGIAFGGFNVVDIKRLHEESGYPVIVVTRDMPDFDEIKNALKHTDDPSIRLKMMEDAGKPHFVKTKGEKGVYIQFVGLEKKDAEGIVSVCATRSLLPEAIRCAHLIGQGLALGQSRGSP
ncbi:MAG: DUF99 family protein [Candidatus Altiarchaeota archaeon]|nr:DUF99 family protein [Candidatus Altiarchaeota archaeon]